MKTRWTLSFCILLASPLVLASEAKPVFHPLAVPPGKSAQDLKPSPEARADSPVVLELRAHRHADGSLHYECDHEHSRVQSKPSEGAQE